MSNNMTLANMQKSKPAELTDIDGLIKLILATILAVMPFYYHKMMSLGILACYLFLVTLFSKIKLRTLIISASSYFIIVVLPYVFGLLLNYWIYSFSHANAFVLQQRPDQIFLRFFRLFVIWYVSILYFHTTPMTTVLGLLEKLLTPLKFLGVPIQDFLKIIMCTVQELKGSGTEIKKNLKESMRSVTGGQGLKKFRLDFKGLSQIIVSLIVNSFEKLDRVEGLIERMKPEDLYQFHFRFSKKELLVVFSFIALIMAVIIVEKGILL